MKKTIVQIAIFAIIPLLSLSLMIDGSQLNNTFLVNALLIYKGLVVAAMTLFVQIIIHELGHVICGVKNNYSFYGFQILGLTIYKQEDKLKLRADGFTNALGLAIMIPNETISDENQIAFYKSGYIANAVTLIPLVILYILSSAVRPYILISIIITIFMVFSNVLPTEVGGNFNDGYLVNLYKTDGEKRAMVLDTQKLQQDLIMGIRPSELPYYEVKHEDNVFAIMINLFMYYKGLDSGDKTLMEERIEMIEHKYHMLENIQKDSFIYELIYYNCCVRDDKLKATKLFSEIESRLEKDMDINARRILAYYNYSAKLDIDIAVSYAKQGLELKDKYPIKGIAIMEEKLIMDLLEAIKAGTQ